MKLDSTQKELKREEIKYEDFEKAINDYEELIELREEYDKTKLNRRMLSNIISKKIDELNEFSHHLETDLQALKFDFMRKGYYISDYDTLLNVLLRVANQEEEKYAIKYFSKEDFHGDVELLGEKEIVESEKLEKAYNDNNFASALKEEILNGNSFIVVSDYLREQDIKPFGLNNKELDRFDLLVEREPGGKMTCYLHESSLKDAVYKYLTFARDNGSDIKGIEEDYLYDVINKNGKARTLSK